MCKFSVRNDIIKDILKKKTMSTEFLRAQYLRKSCYKLHGLKNAVSCLEFNEPNVVHKHILSRGLCSISAFNGNNERLNVNSLNEQAIR